MFKKLSLDEFVQTVIARTPTPGGGSVSVYAGALGAALGGMSANFTIGNKKYEKYEIAVKEILKNLEERMGKLVDLVEEDVKAYTMVTKSFALPKSDDSETLRRKAEIQKSLRGAMEIPLRGMRVAMDILKLLKELVDKCNPNLISDVGVGAILANACLKGCKLNVKINISSIKEDNMMFTVQKEIDTLEKAANEVEIYVLKKCYEIIDK